MWRSSWTSSNRKINIKRGGAEAACWAHNPKVGGSKPSLVKLLSLQIEDQYKIKTLLDAALGVIVAVIEVSENVVEEVVSTEIVPTDNIVEEIVSSMVVPTEVIVNEIVVEENIPCEIIADKNISEIIIDSVITSIEDNENKI